MLHPLNAQDSWLRFYVNQTIRGSSHSKNHAQNDLSDPGQTIRDGYTTRGILTFGGNRF